MSSHTIRKPDPFKGCEEARRKYGWMYWPSLEQRESLFLDEDGGTSWITRRLLQSPISIFRGCKEASESMHIYCLRISSIGNMKTSILIPGPQLMRLTSPNRQNIFDSRDEARSKYGWITSPTLKQWEYLYLDSDGGVEFLKESGYENVKHLLQECK